MLFKHTYGFGKYFSPDGEGGGGAGAGVVAVDAVVDPAVGEPAAKPVEPSANKLIKDFAASRGVTVESLLTQFSDLENKGKTELQRLNDERDTFKTQAETNAASLRTERAERAVLAAAAKANAVDPDAVLALATSRLEFDADGKPTNVDAVIDALRTEKAERFKASAGSLDGGAAGPVGSESNDMNVRLRRAAGRRG